VKKNIYFLLLIILSLNSTPQELIEAVRVRDIDRVNEFLARNISPLLVDNLGRSLLLMALENEDADIARTLINSHGGIHKARLLAFSDSFNNKPLHIAAKFGDLDLLNDLYYTGFDIDSQNDNDDTPLHIASRNGNLEAVRFFIEKGANFDITNQSDYTPLDSARRHQGVESDVYNYLNNLLQSDGLSSIGSVETDDDYIGEYNSDITDLEDFNLFVTRELTHHNLDVVENLPNLTEMFNTVLDGRGYVTRDEIMG